MSPTIEALARELERKAQDAVATLDGLDDAEWVMVTEAERWPVGVTAHHIAGVLEPISGMITAVASRRVAIPLRMELIDAMNAQHARDFAWCTKAETIALLRRNADLVAGVIRGLRADQLPVRETVLEGAPPMSVQELITGGLLAHMDEHFGSIRRTVGHD
jgi:DinB family protein